MQRIDGPTVSAVLPAPLATGAGPSAPGFFSHPDLLAGIAPTTLNPDWANSVQEEIAHVIEESGQVLNKADNTQLYNALATLFGVRNTGNLTAAKGHFDLDSPLGTLRINWGKTDVAANSATTDTFDAPYSQTFGVWHGGGTTDPTQGYKTAAWPGDSGGVGLSGCNLLNGTAATLTVHWLALGLAPART